MDIWANSLLLAKPWWDQKLSFQPKNYGLLFTEQPFDDQLSVANFLKKISKRAFFY